MPQMSPTWWTLIMIMTISLLMISMSMMYFSFIYTNKQSEKT